MERGRWSYAAFMCCGKYCNYKITLNKVLDTHVKVKTVNVLTVNTTISENRQNTFLFKVHLHTFFDNWGAVKQTENTILIIITRLNFIGLSSK